MSEEGEFAALYVEHYRNPRDDGRKEASVSTTEQTNSGPSETKNRDVFRALPAGLELRADGDGMPTLVGNLAVFNEWTEIRSASEGHFLERMAPGAFTKTVAENSDRMRVLFNHGRDPSVGEKPLGPIRSLEIDEDGVHYEVDLLDTSYNRDLLPGLAANLYGSSFRFGVVRYDEPPKRKKSDYNPKGLPERTVTELRMSEFGPVTFPAYAGAKSGIRSLTDQFSGVRLDAAPSALRADMEAISILTDMYELGQQFIEAEDDPDDGPDVAAMKTILDSIQGLIKTEAAEDEGAEDEGAEMMNSAPPNGRAERKAHPVSGRRASIYSTSRKETESWRIQ